jgi:hypothetical protein
MVARLENEQAAGTGLVGLLKRHAVSASPWYAVIDAAQGAEVPQRARESGLRVESLYEGRLGERVADVAPHLASLDLGGPFASWLMGRWPGHHAVLLQSEAAFSDLRRHFRRFLQVRDEAGKRYRFRFYDPRILRAFLPACTSEEAAEFLGPVGAYFVKSRHPFGLLRMSKNARGSLVVQELNGPSA